MVLWFRQHAFEVGPNFTTLGSCPNVGNLAVTSPNPTKATFTWDASNGAYSFVRLKARPEITSDPINSWFNIEEWELLMVLILRIRMV